MILIIVSISLAGSSLFFITFSWITVLAALLKTFFMGYGQTKYQWLSLILMTFGLCCSALDARMLYGMRVFYGILAGFGASIVYSIYYITCDALGNLKDAPSPESLAAFDGLVGTLVLGLAIMFYEGPHWSAFVVNPYKKVLCFFFCFLAVNNIYSSPCIGPWRLHDHSFLFHLIGIKLPCSSTCILLHSKAQRLCGTLNLFSP
jgi:hypothetical protein